LNYYFIACSSSLLRINFIKAFFKLSAISYYSGYFFSKLGFAFSRLSSLSSSGVYLTEFPLAEFAKLIPENIFATGFFVG
jgi:hypothetical protein